MVMIRKESPGDYAAVRRINELAFGQADEAEIVDRLRGVAQPLISLVAVLEGRVVGHILFSPVSIETEGSAFPALGLGPMAVLPGFQRQGVGSELVRHGLEEGRRLNQTVVVLIGHPEFYPRFGFSSAKAKGLRCEFEVPEEAFMVAELTPGALRGRVGVVKFRPEFGGC